MKEVCWMESVVRCTWPVREGGYEWVDSRDKEGTTQRVLVPVNAAEHSRLRWSRPLDRHAVKRALDGSDL